MLSLMQHMPGYSCTSARCASHIIDLSASAQCQTVGFYLSALDSSAQSQEPFDPADHKPQLDLLMRPIRVCTALLTHLRTL